MKEFASFLNVVSNKDGKENSVSNARATSADSNARATSAGLNARAASADGPRLSTPVLASRRLTLGEELAFWGWDLFPNPMWHITNGVAALLQITVLQRTAICDPQDSLVRILVTGL